MPKRLFVAPPFDEPQYFVALPLFLSNPQEQRQTLDNISLKMFAFQQVLLQAGISLAAVIKPYPKEVYFSDHEGGVKMMTTAKFSFRGDQIFYLMIDTASAKTYVAGVEENFLDRPAEGKECIPYKIRYVDGTIICYANYKRITTIIFKPEELALKFDVGYRPKVTYLGRDTGSDGLLGLADLSAPPARKKVRRLQKLRARLRRGRFRLLSKKDSCSPFALLLRACETRSPNAELMSATYVRTYVRGYVGTW